jgi:hypothetical protein
MSTLHNLSSHQIADEYGTLDLQIKALTERKDALKDELKARGVEKVEGAKFTITVSTSTRTTYDDKAIREALGSEIVKQYERVTETMTLRVKPTVVFGEVAA